MHCAKCPIHMRSIKTLLSIYWWFYQWSPIDLNVALGLPSLINSCENSSFHFPFCLSVNSPFHSLFLSFTLGFHLHSSSSSLSFSFSVGWCNKKLEITTRRWGVLRLVMIICMIVPTLRLFSCITYRAVRRWERCQALFSVLLFGDVVEIPNVCSVGR